MDIRGMLCTCGKQLIVVSRDDGGCCVLACPNKKCEKGYRIPLIAGTSLPFPWDTKRVKTYNCRKCGARIDEAQAQQTFNDSGRALCTGCVD